MKSQENNVLQWGWGVGVDHFFFLINTVTLLPRWQRNKQNTQSVSWLVEYDLKKKKKGWALGSARVRVFSFKSGSNKTSLVVQWLRLLASTAGNMDLIPS